MPTDPDTEIAYETLSPDEQVAQVTSRINEAERLHWDAKMYFTIEESARGEDGSFVDDSHQARHAARLAACKMYATQIEALKALRASIVVPDPPAAP